MRLLRIFVFFWALGIAASYAAEDSTSMVDVENYFDTPLNTVGWIDYPPFSRYVPSQKVGKKNLMELESAFLKPTMDVMGKHGINLVPVELFSNELDLKLMLLDVRSGKHKVFIGAYSNTQLYSGLQMIFPASVSNPIHVITSADSMTQISSFDDLKNMRGVMSKTELLSDFIVRKVAEMGVEFLDTPYECYEKLILGKADYMVGGLYYNRMISSHYGVSSFLSYSQKPLFKIPVFIAISKVTPRLSQYMEVFQEEFAKPEYATAVKEEIIRIVSEEERRYEGTVPPSFVQYDTEDEPKDFLEVEDDLTDKGGHVIEQKVEEKSIDEVIEGIY